jgi:hypothetical protein
MTDSIVTMAYAMLVLVGIGLVYLLLVPLVIFLALPLIVSGVSLQVTALPVAVIAVGIWIAYTFVVCRVTRAAQNDKIPLKAAGNGGAPRTGTEHAPSPQSVLVRIPCQPRASIAWAAVCSIVPAGADRPDRLAG